MTLVKQWKRKGQKTDNMWSSVLTDASLCRRNGGNVAFMTEKRQRKSGSKKATPRLHFPISLNTYSCKASLACLLPKEGEQRAPRSQSQSQSQSPHLHPHSNTWYNSSQLSASISGIEKVDSINSKMDMESQGNINGEEALGFEEEQGLREDKDGKDEKLKRRISSHPLYQLLVEAHLECLKVGDISDLEREQKILQMQAMKKQNLRAISQSAELDLFMESYCLALGKLKEAMEEPQQKSLAFINNMHSQLRELTKTTVDAAAESAATTSASSSESKLRRGTTI